MAARKESSEVLTEVMIITLYMRRICGHVAQLAEVDPAIVSRICLSWIREADLCAEGRNLNPIITTESVKLFLPW